MEGYGIMLYENGYTFEGYYRKGPGRYTYNDGRIKVGIWDGDIFSEVLDSQEIKKMTELFTPLKI